MLDRKTVLNTFRPNHPVDRPGSFAGRAELVAEITDALQIDGSIPVIYGDRGLGKSSLALQIARIALGDIELLTDIGKPERALSKSQLWTVVYVACSDTLATKDAVLQRIINTAEGFARLDDFSQMQLQATSSTTRFKLSVIEHETQSTYERTSGHAYASLDMEERLLAVLQTLSTKGHPRILVIIDELDRVLTDHGLASFLKNASSPDLKFLLVGVAANISTLISDHESITRSLSPAMIHRMNRQEARGVVDKAMHALRDRGANVAFSNAAITALVKAASGVPWFVHVLGQEALIQAWDSDLAVIGEDCIAQAIRRLAQNRYARQFEDTYVACVRDSRQREIVLRCMAKWNGEDVFTSEIYPKAKQLGVTNPSVCKKDLTRKKYKAIIADVPFQDRGVVRFVNSMFKRYVCLRGSIYEGVAQAVDKAWEEPE